MAGKAVPVRGEQQGAQTTRDIRREGPRGKSEQASPAPTLPRRIVCVQEFPRQRGNRRALVEQVSEPEFAPTPHSRKPVVAQPRQTVFGRRSEPRERKRISRTSRSAGSWPCWSRATSRDLRRHLGSQRWGAWRPTGTGCSSETNSSSRLGPIGCGLRQISRQTRKASGQTAASAWINWLPQAGEWSPRG